MKVMSGNCLLDVVRLFLVASVHDMCYQTLISECFLLLLVPD